MGLTVYPWVSRSFDDKILAYLNRGHKTEQVGVFIINLKDLAFYISLT